MPGERHLTSKERELLREALLDAYSSFPQIRQMVEEAMSDPLHDIAHPISMTDGVAGLIRWALENDRTYELAVALRADRPKNPKVVKLWKAIDGTPSLVSGQVKSAAARLESIAYGLAAQIPGTDLAWVEVAQRLQPTTKNVGGSTRRQVIRRFASLQDTSRAGELTTALLLRMAELANDHDSAPIAEALDEYWDAALRLKENVFGGRAVYVVAVKSQNWPDFVVDHVWFYEGADGAPPWPFPDIPNEGLPLDKVLSRIWDHMERHHTAGVAMVELAVPLRGLLDAPPGPLVVHYSLTFRWRERSEARGPFRPVGLLVATLTQQIKARCRQGLVGGWLSPSVEPKRLYERLGTDLDLPLLRHEAEWTDEVRAQTLETLLTVSAAPFAVICRPSLPAGDVGHEKALSECAMQNRELCQLPRQIYHQRAGQPGLNHVTVLWDDFDYNPLRDKYSH
jgi:hypothetical protein